MKKNSCLLLIIMLLKLCFSFSQFPFPKKIWAFWDQPNELSQQKSSIYVRICFYHLKSISQKYGWQLHLISSKNVHKYIDNYKEDWEDVIKNAKFPLLQSRSDLARLLLIKKYGGIYMDITTMLIHGLKWIQDIEKHPYLITNKVEGVEPDVILFSFSLFQNNLQFRNPTSQSLINQHPGLQGWFIAAKPQTPFITDWLKWFQTFYQMRLEEKLEIFEKEGIYYRNLQTNQYLNVDKSLDYTLQRKQFQLDRNLSIFSSKSDRIFALNHYKVWSINGQYGPFAFISGFLDYQSLTIKTIQQVKQKQFPIKFFVKTSHVHRGRLQRLFTVQEEMIKQNVTIKNLTLFKSKIVKQYHQCMYIKFPIKGSVIDKILQENIISKQEGFFSINKQDLPLWQDYCIENFINHTIQIMPIWYFKKNLGQKIQSFWDNLYFRQRIDQTIPLIAKPHSIVLQQNNNLTLKETIIVYSKINIIQLRIFIKQLFWLLILIFLNNYIAPKIFGFIKNNHKTFRKYFSKCLQSMNLKTDYFKTNKKSTQVQEQIVESISKKINKYQLKDIAQYFIIIIFTIVVNVKFQLFNTYGVRKDSSLVVVTLVIILQIIKKMFKLNLQTSFLINQQKITNKSADISRPPRKSQKISENQIEFQKQQLPITERQLKSSPKEQMKNLIGCGPFNIINKQYFTLWQFCQPMIILSLGQSILSFFVVRENHISSLSIYILLLGPYLLEKSQIIYLNNMKTYQQSNQKPTCTLFDLQFFLYKYRYLNKYLIIASLLLCQFTNIQYTLYYGSYIVRYFVFIPFFYVTVVMGIVLKHHIDEVRNNLKEQEKNWKQNWQSYRMAIKKYYKTITSVLEILFIITYMMVAIRCKFYYYQYWTDYGIYHSLMKFVLIIFIGKRISLKIERQISSQQGHQYLQKLSYSIIYLIFLIIATIAPPLLQIINYKIQGMQKYTEVFSNYLFLHILIVFFIFFVKLWILDAKINKMESQDHNKQTTMNYRFNQQIQNQYQFQQ